MSVRGSVTRRGVVASVLTCAVLLGVAATGYWLVRPSGEPATTPAPVRARSVTTPDATPTVLPAMRVTRATTLTPRPVCDQPTKGVAPTAISIPSITSGAVVLTPPRDSDNIPGAPPLTTAGKHMFAWDTAQGTRPGDPTGNVLLNAHTWPDGSALGNQMLAHLFPGGRVVVEGDGLRLCYEVIERVEVLASEGLARYYALDGPPQLAILACSGRRLGPGSWEKRTVWFASPV